MSERIPVHPEEPLRPPSHLPPTEPALGADGTRRYDGLTYARTLGYRPLLLDLHVPPARATPFPLVVWIHGGGWADGDRRYPPPTVPAELLFGSLLRAGLAVATVDYRYTLEAPFPAQLHDVRAAIRYLRHFAGELGLDRDRLAVWGESAGAHLAAMAALAPSATPEGLDLEGREGVAEGSSGDIRAVVDWYGPVELASAAAAFPPALALPPAGHPFPALLGADPTERPDLVRAYSPVTYADQPGPPFLLIHGTADQVVPFSQSELLAARLAPHTTVELLPVPGADHIFAGAPDIEPLVTRSVDFLRRHLTTQEQ